MSWLVRSAIFVCLSAYGVFALWTFATKNGTFALASQWSSQNRLPESDTKYPTEFTRITQLDEFLRGLVTFFWPMVNGAHPDSSLMGFYFAGQGIVAWILTVLEGARQQNRAKWRVSSFTTTFGLLFQSLGIGIVGPLFFAFANLSDSWPGVSFDSTSELVALPFSTITGLIIPTVLMSLHAPTVLTLQQKVDAVRIWQFFPLWCYLSQWIWTPIAQLIMSNKSAGKDAKSQRHALRQAYSFGLFCAMVPHAGTICISLTSLMFPHLFAEGVPALLHPANVFVPMSPSSVVKAESLGQGAHWFLQWDMVLMFFTYLVWAYFANSEVTHPGSTLAFSTIMRLLGLSVLVGPMGAALLAMWERDEVVFEKEIDRLSTSKP